MVQLPTLLGLHGALRIGVHGGHEGQVYCAVIMEK